jgi:hypothetical protein
MTLGAVSTVAEWERKTTPILSAPTQACAKIIQEFPKPSRGREFSSCYSSSVANIGLVKALMQAAKETCAGIADDAAVRLDRAMRGVTPALSARRRPLHRRLVERGKAYCVTAAIARNSK